MKSEMKNGHSCAASSQAEGDIATTNDPSVLVTLTLPGPRRTFIVNL